MEHKLRPCHVRNVCTNPHLHPPPSPPALEYVNVFDHMNGPHSTCGSALVVEQHAAPVHLVFLQQLLISRQLGTVFPSASAGSVLLAGVLALRGLEAVLLLLLAFEEGHELPVAQGLLALRGLEAVLLLLLAFEERHELPVAQGLLALRGLLLLLAFDELDELPVPQGVLLLVLAVVLLLALVMVPRPSPNQSEVLYAVQVPRPRPSPLLVMPEREL